MAIVKSILVRRVYNLGNYNTRHVEVVQEVAPYDDYEKVGEALIETVEAMVRLDTEQEKAKYEVLYPPPGEGDLPWDDTKAASQ